MGEIFRAVREAGQDERRARREAAPKILAQHDVGFVAFNGGAHLLVRGRIDFWPGTGRWQERDPEAERARAKARPGRGVFALLRYLGVETSVRGEDE